ncbi:MAG: hypothetical protein J5643_09135 [Lachnospiraceae bacterium]|nr:hypothetical protein [Lachnospiraceae bacterium]
MSQNNLSERKQKLRKQNKNRPNPNENVPKKVSKDQIKKERQREREAAVVPEERKKRKIAVTAVMLKTMLTLTTAIGVYAIVFHNPDTQMRQVLRGVAAMGIPLAIYLTVEAFYKTSSRGRYFGRLMLGAILAQFPMHFLAYYDNARNAAMRKEYFEGLGEMEQVEYLLKWREFPMLNYLFTIIFALFFIWLLNLVFSKFMSPDTNMAWKGFYGACMVLILVLGIVAGVFLQTLKIIEAPVFTVMLVFACVLLRGKAELLSIVLGIIGVTFGLIAGPDNGKPYFAIGAALAAFLIRFYQGRLGYDKEKYPRVKYWFYLIYLSVLAAACVAGMYVYVQTYGGN